MTLHREEALAQNVYERPGVSHVAEWHVPYEADDRSYMMLMYQEHAQLARQQEYLRALWSTVLVALGAVILLSARDDTRQWLSGAGLATVGTLGALALAKHYARYKLHVSVMRSFRMALAETVRSDVSRLSTKVRLQHDQNHRWLGLISLHGVFLLLALAMVGGGAEMIWRSVETEAAVIADSGLAAALPDSRKPVGVVAPGSGQP